MIPVIRVFWKILIIYSSVLCLQMKRYLDRGGSRNAFTGLDSSISPFRHPQPKDSGNEQKASIATLFEQGNRRISEI